MSASTLSEINNTGGVFNTMQLEKVQGGLVNKNIIYSNDHEVLTEESYNEGLEDHAQTLKLKIDSSINELNSLYEGFLKQKQ